MTQPLSVMTWAEHRALPVGARLERGRQAERYRRAGYRVPAIRALKDQILRGAGCVLCGSTRRMSVDHIHPIILGGTHAPDNVRILCGSCNSSKGGRS